jgi:hypothetical protein
LELAILAATCLLLSVVLALWLLGTDRPSSRGAANWLAGAYATATLLATGWVVVALRRNQRMGLLVLLLAQSFWFALPAMSSLVGGVWFGTPIRFRLGPEDVQRSTLYLSLFAVLSVAGYALVSNRLAKRSQAGPSRGPERHVTRMGLVVFLLTVIGVSPFVIYGESLQAVISGVMGSRAVEKGWSMAAFESKPLYVIGRAALVTAGLLALHEALRARRRRFLWLAPFLLAFLATYFDSGTRSWTAMILAPPVLVAMARNLARLQFRRWLVLGPVVLVCLLWLAYFQAQFRNLGVSGARPGTALTLSDNDFFTETTIALSLVPEKVEPLHESALLLHLVNPIPRSLWPGKPYPRVIETYTWARSGWNEYGEAGISRMPSVVGQYYLSWGAPGVIGIALFIGALMAWLDALWRRHATDSLVRLWAATTAAWCFVSFRGIFPGFHYPVLLVGLLLLYRRAATKRVGARRPVGRPRDQRSAHPLDPDQARST